MLSQLNESPKPRERRLFLVSLIPVVIGCSLHLLIAGITLSNRGVLAGSEYLTTVFAPQMIMFFIFYKRVVIPYMANGFENQIRFRSHTAILFITFLAVGFCSNIYFPGIEDRQPYWVSLLYWVFTAALGLVLIFSYNYVFHHERLKAKEALQQAERAKAEIDLLKRQINPHFLFNVMNNLYGLIEMRDNRASQLLSRLSKLLRYLLFDSSNPYVPLSKEQLTPLV